MVVLRGVVVLLGGLGVAVGSATVIRSEVVAVLCGSLIFALQRLDGLALLSSPSVGGAPRGGSGVRFCCLRLRAAGVRFTIVLKECRCWKWC